MAYQTQNICAVERKIKEINPETDSKVRVIGTVLNKTENSLMLDDGEGTVQIFADSKALQNVVERKIVRVIGHILPGASAFDIKAEIVQDMTGLNLKTHETVQKLWNHNFLRVIDLENKQLIIHKTIEL